MLSCSDLETVDVDANNHIEMQFEVEKCEIKTVESIVSTREEMKIQGNWTELPSLPLENIYSFLDRFDQFNMSLVCRKWSAGYSSPSVWKTFRFALTESMLSEDNCPVMKFVLKYSSMFQHVDIHYRLFLSTPKHLIDIWCKHFVVFLQMLTSNSQLISVKMQNLMLCFMPIDSLTRANVQRAIATFLGSQHYLKKVELRLLSAYFQEYEDILKNLNEMCRDNITYLGIHGLKIVCDSNVKEQDSVVVKNLLTVLCFPNLKTLAVDYSKIFENTFSCQSVAMETLKNCQTRSKLLNIIMDYDKYCAIGSFQGLTSADWLFLKKLYPNLRVRLNFTVGQSTQREVEFLIVPEMPIFHLYLTHKESCLHSNDPLPLKIDVLFTSLLQRMTTDHLVNLCFKWSLPISDLTSTFIPFLQAFKKLEYLRLFITYPANGIEIMLESWLENQPESLKYVYICFSGLEKDHGSKILEKLNTDYISRLELVGLRVKFDISKDVM